MTEEELEAQAEALEEQAAEESDDGLAAATAALIVAFTALWAVYGIAEVRTRLIGMLDDLPGPADPEHLRDVLIAATLLGAAAAAADPPPVPLDPNIWTEAQGIAGKVRNLLDKARVMAATVESYDDLVRVAAVAREAGRVAKRTARNLVNRAISSGTTFVCDALDLHRQWHAEADACVHCRTYHGHVAAPGQPFPGGLTPLSLQPVDNPPLHPNCRCRVWPRRAKNNT